jgi:hypothetical protein
LLLVACSSSRNWHNDAAARSEVERRLAEVPDAMSALADGGVTYAIPADRLVEEREALLDAVREAKYSFAGRLEKEASLSTKGPIVAWHKTGVFEVAYPDGSLQIRRDDLHDGTPATFAICFLKGNNVYMGGVKSGGAIDIAWQQLSIAASARVTHHMVKEVDRPLQVMRGIGVDVRGLDP